MLQNKARKREVLSHTEHLHGPRRIRLSDTEILLVLLTRDAAWYLETFLNHHLGIGVKHVLVIDNGSSDDTVEICRKFDKVTVLQNTLPAKRYESHLRSDLAADFASGGWILFADSDELIEFPKSREGSIEGFTRYCNAEQYTAVVGQVLDRFTTEPFEKVKDLDYEASVNAFNMYSLRELEKIDYGDPEKIPFSWHMKDNVSSCPEVKLLRGGVRRELFGENPFLSRHVLVRNQPGVVPMAHPHAASNVSIADFTILIQHYKFCGDWISREMKASAAALWDYGEDKVRLSVVGESDSFQFRPRHPLSWRGIETLYPEGFLFASDTSLRCIDLGRD